MGNAYEDLLNWCDQIASGKMEEKFLEAVTDEEGNEVHIVLDTHITKDGKGKHKCVSAIYPDGTIYPEYADRKVMDTINKILGK